MIYQMNILNHSLLSNDVPMNSLNDLLNDLAIDLSNELLNDLSNNVLNSFKQRIFFFL